MLIDVPSDDRPRRELESSALTHGGRLLTITVPRVAGRRKNGEARTRPLTTTYAVEGLGPGRFDLVKADGTAYTVTAWGCTCRDEEFAGRERWCKHRTACAKHGLLPDVAGPTGE